MEDPAPSPETQEPKAVGALPPVSLAARDLAADLARIKIKSLMTVFRFLFGGTFIAAACVLIVVTHLTATAGWFTEGFPDEAWNIFWVLIFAGAAFSGPEIVDSIKTGLGLGGGRSASPPD